MKNSPQKIFVVIPVHNRKKITLECLKKLQGIKQENFRTEVVVVDDGSIDGTYDAVRSQYPSVILLKGNGSLWWSGATNLGVRYALENKADYVLTLNDDVDFDQDFLVHLFNTGITNPRTIVCCLICDARNRELVLSAGRYRAGFLGYKTPARYEKINKKDITDETIESELESGYAMLIPAEVFRKTGLFDQYRFPHHMGDMDFVIRARNRGYLLVINTRAILFTATGDNYLANFFPKNTFIETLRALFDIKSTICLKTRLWFIYKHTSPRILIPVSAAFFLLRMTVLLLIKAILPYKLVERIAAKRYG